MFYKENNFKNTEIGEVPKDWETIKVKDAIEEVTKYAHKIKTREYLARGSFPVVDQSSSFIAGYTNYNAPFTDVPVIVFGDHTGILKYIDFDFVMGADGTKILKPKNAIYAKYLYFVLKGSRFRTEGYRRHMAILRELTISISKNSHEQQKIAEILSNIDTAIQKTNELVISSQRLKKGLMQSLLTKGIGHKKFEETEIGKIPAGWEIKKVMDLFEVETGTTPATRNAEYWENGTVTWLTPTDLSTVKGVYLGDSKRKVTDRALKETNLTLLPKGSILLSTRAPVGYAAIIMQDSTFNQGCKGLIPKANVKSTEEFYCYYLIKSKTLLQNLSSGSTFKELAKDRLENFLVPVPPVSERHKISEILLKLDKELEADRRELIYLRKIKKGFMNELLSGKVRVK